MKELTAGFLFCDLQSTETITDGVVTAVYKYKFNAGRLVAGLILMAASAAIGVWVL